ncbi:MAG: pyridoxal phosphate-dependent aminotransferase [Candidatus Heimdallarchaeota archaeon]|nr:pyridoxal phosphate-dependent aminotransferase [Candidatus Heimdallarchaeota archaeon]
MFLGQIRNNLLFTQKDQIKRMPTSNLNRHLGKISSRMTQIQPSGLRELFDLEHKIAKSSSNTILSFGLGNLNIPTLSEIIEEMKIVLDNPVSHRYSSNAGILALREALSERYFSKYQLEYTTEQILVTGGSLEALFDVFIALLDPGDEVLIQDPTFNPYYSNQITIAGGRVKPIKLNEKFQLDPESIIESLTPKTKAILLNFPSNPTGSVMTRSQIKDVVETAADNKIVVISDEAYEDIVYDKHKHTCAAEIDYENVIVISSFSKTFSMTGFRLGYVLGIQELIKPISLVHQQNTACANTPSQMAAIKALHLHPSIRDPMMLELNKRRKETIKVFTSIEGISLQNDPLGAFYIFPNVSDTGMNGDEFSKFLLEKCQVVVVPGSGFGNTTKDFVRVSYGFLNPEEIQEAGSRIKSLI